MYLLIPPLSCPSLLPSLHWLTLVCSLYLWICCFFVIVRFFFDVSHITWYVSSSVLTLLKHSNTLQVHPHCCKWQNVHLSVDDHLRLLMAIINNAVRYIGVPISFRINVCFLYIYIYTHPGLELLDDMAVLVFWGCFMFSPVVPPIFISTNYTRVTLSPHPCQSFTYSLFVDSHSKRCDIFHCHFDVHFSDNWWCWASSLVPVDYLCVFGKTSIQVLSLFCLFYISKLWTESEISPICLFSALTSGCFLDLCG